MNPTQTKREWIVFWERDDQYAVTVSTVGDEREVAAYQAILSVLGGRGTMQDNYRVWAVPADEIRPRPFTVNAVTNYVDVLGEPFIRDDEPICDGEFAGPNACVCGHPERHDG